MRLIWALYVFTMIATWQRFVSLNMSLDFDVPRKVVRKKGVFTVVVPSVGDRLMVDICLTLITLKPRFTNQSEMSSAGAETGRCRITAFVDFWYLG
jgi:hypothetical protein